MSAARRPSPRLRLFHWREVDAQPHVAQLRAAGYRVEFGPLDRGLMRLLRADPPAVVVIDLACRPSQGRDLGIWLRSCRSTRPVPLVFVGGDRQQVAAIRCHLPDATYTEWRRIRSALRSALARPLRAPVVPTSTFAAYAGTPLPRKLGIKPGTRLALIEAPADLAESFGPLPTGVRSVRGLRGACDLAIWFPKSRRQLERRIRQVAARAGPDGLWIAWPKRSSGVPSDLSQKVVREVGLAAGLVDYKICAIDATYSALRFTRRKAR